MKNWLIHLFGCVRLESYNLLNIEYMQQRELVSTYRARVDFLEKQLAEEKEERKGLQTIIYRNFGINLNDLPPEEQGDPPQPISTAPRRMSTVLRMMEQDDRRRVAEEAKKSNALP